MSTPYVLSTSLDTVTNIPPEPPVVPPGILQPNGLQKLKNKSAPRYIVRPKTTLDFQPCLHPNEGENEDLVGVMYSEEKKTIVFQTSALKKYLDKQVHDVSNRYAFQKAQDSVPLLLKYDYKMNKGCMDFYFGLYVQNETEYYYYDIIKCFLLYEPNNQKQIRIFSLQSPTSPSLSEIILDNIRHNPTENLVQIEPKSGVNDEEDTTIPDDSVSGSTVTITPAPPRSILTGKQRSYLTLFTHARLLNYFLDEECLILMNPKSKKYLTKTYWIATTSFSLYDRLTNNKNSDNEQSSEETIQVSYRIGVSGADNGHYYLYPYYSHPVRSEYDTWDYDHQALSHPENLEFRVIWTAKRNPSVQVHDVWDIELKSICFVHQENTDNEGRVLQELSNVYTLIKKKIEGLIEYSLEEDYMNH